MGMKEESMRRQLIEGGKMTRALTVGFQSVGNKPPLVAQCFENVWLCRPGKGTARGGRATLIVSRVKEMARALFYYIFLTFHHTPTHFNGICLALNNSSIKRQVRNKELNSQAPYKLLGLSLKDGTLAA